MTVSCRDTEKSNALQGDRKLTESPAPTAPRGMLMMNQTTIDPATFAELQATAGSDFVIDLVDTFAEEAPQMLAEMRAAQADAAAERFRRAAHSLKSNGNTFGALRLGEMARTLELGGLPSSAEGFRAVDALAAELEHALSALKALARSRIE